MTMRAVIMIKSIETNFFRTHKSKLTNKSVNVKLLKYSKKNVFL